ncbi:NAD(P)H-dependent glycerol-3-phosphate dehydrogenase [Pseudothermotoga thermarum]|uniref:Glycerol-3-phosphate dehydrogenase [NAD(P)+] n=1 Tax=Pseudothermotoga thermarum DSM 5069 TaxID=688269 RepID=F7YTD2_9THEM|nr:NAD(P)H-dependent glycerol-3-phosphate dehydrogenase [Pseudothermotoga thermarum]AEH50110.1 glycerol 3-phosphate dehydrogenase (NAD(P)+) [Pseudothermotoga thermarum DSM 5069]
MKFGILGAGSWGTAFAKLLAENGQQVMLWARRKELAEQLICERENKDYLPGVKLPSQILTTTDIEELENFCEVLVIAVPVKYVETTLSKLKKGSKIVLNLSKGIDEKMRTVGKIVSELNCFETYAVLSGPCHAIEVSHRLPTSVVVASEDQSVAELLQKVISNSYFRVYTSKDVAGVEISGAMKNVIAIAAGVIDGLGGWHNAKASLIARGIHEIAKFGLAYGAKDPLTFMGLAGIGDLVVTCTSPYSRNRYVGEMIGKGKRLDEVLANMKMVAEGVNTVKPLLQLSKTLDVETPICGKVYEVLFEGKDPKAAIEELMKRPLKPEMAFQTICP